MHLLRASLRSLVVLFAAGCTGPVLEVGDDHPSGIPADLSTRCPAPSATTRRFDTDDQARLALVGRWYRCRGQGTRALYFAGIDFAGNREWFSLEDTPEGIVRASEPARRGTFDVIRGSILLFIADGSQQSALPLFDASGQTMNIVYTDEPVDVAFVRE